MKEVMFSKPAKLAGSYDVVVCGGGPAGFIAAIAAAKQGARTAIIERFGFFGGLATAGYVAPISVFSYNGELNIGGIPWDFVKQLEAMGGALVEQPLNNVAFDIEKYKLCAQRMMIDAGVDMYMNSWITGVESKNGKVSKVFSRIRTELSLWNRRCLLMPQVMQILRMKPVSHFRNGRIRQDSPYQCVLFLAE